MTPEEALNDMCDLIIRHDTVAFMDVVQFFWRRKWALDQIPDPKDTDTLRYALKACFLERMAEIWSAPPKNRASIAPAWCKDVLPSEKRFAVVPDEYISSWDENTTSKIFSNRNIFAPMNFMFFV